VEAVRGNSDQGRRVGQVPHLNTHHLLTHLLTYTHRESNERDLMGQEDDYTKYLLACAAITKALLRHYTEGEVLEKAFRLGGRIAERYHVKIITG